jgi:hypothetical protein
MDLSVKQKACVHMFSSFLQITLFLPLSYPVDTLKSKLQTKTYESYGDAIKQIRSHGIRPMYRGFIVMYLNLIMKQPMKLALYEYITNPIHAGIMTGLAGLVVGIPMSYIKINYQVNNLFKFNIGMLSPENISKNFIAWKYEGCKEIAGNAAFYGLYKALNKYTKNNSDSPDKLLSLSNGVVAGFIGTYISYPIDTMKSCKQSVNKSYNFKELFNEIYNSGKTGTIRNFWRGVIPTATKHSVVGGVGMMTYETLKHSMYKHLQSK